MKAVSSFELSLDNRPKGQPLAIWLYGELRRAVLEGRLSPGSRLPSSRDFADQHGLARGTVVSAFERLQAEGYLCCRVGSGTWVNDQVATADLTHGQRVATTAYIRRAASVHVQPKPFVNWVQLEPSRPFRMRDPALAEFPAKLWGQLAARRARAFPSWLKLESDRRGYLPLRQAIAQYLATSRGVRCGADQVVIVSGVQQALDLLARLLLRPGDRVWLEDPGYFGASIAFANAGAKIIPVPVDDQGLSLSVGLKRCAGANGVFLTPGHQFPLGMTMSLERRLAVLKWATESGAFIIEDDYDSEYRFEGQPVPALQSLDQGSSVIFLGTFNKLLFPSLRIGYVVLPPSLVDCFLRFRTQTDLHGLNFDQAVLCDFIVGGHLGRHLRRMRDLYASRLAALIDGARRHLQGLLTISPVKAGLYTAGYLQNGMTSRQAEAAAAARDIETRALDRFVLKRPDPRGLLLGFAAFDEKSILRGVAGLAAALDQ